MEEYYISAGYCDNALLFWCQGDRGYSSALKEARRFTEEQASYVIRHDYQKKYLAWPCSYIDNHPEAVRTIVDHQYLNMKTALSHESR